MFTELNWGSDIIAIKTKNKQQNHPIQWVYSDNVHYYENNANLIRRRLILPPTYVTKSAKRYLIAEQIV